MNAQAKQAARLRLMPNSSSPPCSGLLGTLLRNGLLFSAVVLSACTTAPSEEIVPPMEATRFLDLDIMPPVYELLLPPSAMPHRLGLRASPESVRSNLVPGLHDWMLPEPQDLYQTGLASWYGDKFHGRLTANGERYNMNAMTAAHPSLPFDTNVCVRSLLTGKEVQVRINDRGPFVGRRVIDLSRAAAESLGMLSQGLKTVAIWIPSEESPVCGDGDVALKGKGKIHTAESE